MDISSKTTPKRSLSESANPHKGGRETISRNLRFFSKLQQANFVENEKINYSSFEGYVESLSKIDSITSADASALKSYLKYCKSTEQDISYEDMFLS